MATGIYAIENTINSKIYIGQSINVHVRFLGHKSCLERKCHANKYLQRAWNKYGKSKFKFYLIEECDRELLNSRETFWYNYYIKQKGKNNVYNLGHTGEVGTMSEEQKQKISISKKEFYKKHPEALKEMSIARIGEKNVMFGKRGCFYGKHHTEETKEKLRQMQLGTKQSEETKKKKSISESGVNNPMYGKHHTEESKRKMSEHSKGKIITAEWRNKISQKNRNSIWINNGIKTKMIQPIYWQKYEKNGWKKGRLKLNTKGKE